MTARLSPTPKPGAVLAVYKFPFARSSRTEFLYLAKVARVTPSGQILIVGRGARYDAGGREIGNKGSDVICVRWPTPGDRADHRRQYLTTALGGVPWGKRTDEEREAVAKLLGIEVREP